MPFVSPQQLFPEVYKELFARCPLVVSVPRAFNWCGERAVAWGGLQVRQKLPWRTYLGLEPIRGNEIKFGTRKVYFPARREFVDYEFPRRWQENVSRAAKYCVENIFHDTSQGFALHVITDGPAGRSVGDAHALSTALAGALALYYKHVVPADLLRWPDFTPHVLAENNSTNFSRVFKLAIMLPIAFDPPFVHSGGGPFTSLTWGEDPQIFAWRRVSPELEQVFMRSGHDEASLKSASDFDGWSFRELVGDLTPVTPCDFSLIFLGQASVGGMAHLVQANINRPVP